MAANQNVMGDANATDLIWIAPHHAVAGVRLSRTARAIITRVHVEIL